MIMTRRQAIKTATLAGAAAATLAPRPAAAAGAAPLAGRIRHSVCRWGYPAIPVKTNKANPAQPENLTQFLRVTLQRRVRLAG